MASQENFIKLLEELMPILLKFFQKSIEEGTLPNSFYKATIMTPKPDKENTKTFLPEKENETLDHDCSLFLTLNYATREDLMDTPLDNPDMEIFTDGSSFVQDGKRKAGYAVATAEQVLEAKSLPICITTMWEVSWRGLGN